MERGALLGERYRLEESLGRGGMAEVFRAIDEVSGRAVALKRLLDRRDRPRYRTWFRREFHTIAGLHHPSVVEVFDYGNDDGMPFYTMELLEGDELTSNSPVDATEACRLMRDVAVGLAFLHSRGLVHRDVTPKNIRRRADGCAVLLDFGLVTTFGATDDVAGTPGYIAPESALGRPLDHRADLYGLGALGYYLLTGRAPYQARSIPDHVEQARQGIPALHGSIGDVPPALAGLIRDLLSFDSLARPGSAAEVVQRLEVAGQLDGSRLDEIAHGYLASGSMIGREREMKVFGCALSELSSAGKALFIEAPSGLGKSRLLGEIALEARLAGYTVLRCGGAGELPFDVVRRLCEELMTAQPRLAREAAEGREKLLGLLVPELGRQRAPSVPDDALEQRVRLQQALLSWFQAVASEAPLVVLVDDAQRCDEPSSAFLAALALSANDARVLLSVTVRTDEDARAPAMLERLRAASERHHLRGLDYEHTELLLETLFGRVPNLARVASWVHERAGGSPFFSLELARKLVADGAVRYVGASWVVTDGVRRVTAPAALTEALDSAVARVSGRASAVAEALSIYDELPALEEWSRAVGASEVELFGAVGELESAGLLVRDEHGYRFAHDGVREAFQRRLPEQRKQELHLRAATQLAEAGDEQDRTLAIGWHLLHGGDLKAAAVTLERAGTALYDAAAFAEAIPPLEAALAVYREQRAPPHRVLDIRLRLLECGGITDRATALRHEEILPELARWGGIDVARSVSRWLGGYLGLFIGVVWATVRWCGLLFVGRGPIPPVAGQMWGSAASFLCAVHAPLLASARVAALVDELKIFNSIPGVPRGSYLAMKALHAYSNGHFDDEAVAEAIRLFRTSPRGLIPEVRRNAALGLLYGIRAQDHIFDGSHEHDLKALEELGMRVFDVQAAQVRAAYYRFRGEVALAQEAERQLEVACVQSGSLWWLESWSVIVSLLTYVTTRDVVRMRRVLTRVEALIDAGYDFEALWRIGRSHYFRLLLDLERARAEVEAIPAVENGVLKAAAMFTRATLHLASHEPELALAELDAMEALEFDRLPDVLQAACTRALAIAQLGDFERAQELLDGLVPRVEEAGAPSLSALLHETQACVALAKGDPGQAQLHVDQVRARVRATGNPILIGTAERLQTITRQADSHDLTSASEVYSRDAATYVDGAATLARTVAPTYAVGEDRAERALEAFMEEVGASAGFLFLRSPAGWKLGAERGGASVPTGESLLRLVADVGGARPRSETWIESEDWEGGGWQWVVVDGLGGAACLIGVCGHRSTDAPPPAACQAVALALDEVAPSTPAEPGTQVTVPEVPEPRPRPSRP